MYTYLSEYIVDRRFRRSVAAFMVLSTTMLVRNTFRQTISDSVAVSKSPSEYSKKWAH